MIPFPFPDSGFRVLVLPDFIVTAPLPRLSQGLDDRPHPPPPSPLHLSEGLNPPLQAVHGSH